MVHSDDYGLVLPPKIAPKQVVIIPIGNSDKVNELVRSYESKLNNEGVVTYVDNSEKSPGFKFAEAEVNGIPVRIEVGERDLDNDVIVFVRRDTREKICVNLSDLDVVNYTKDLLEIIQRDMYERAKRRRDELTFEAYNLDDFKNIMAKTPGFIKADWCGNEECEVKLKEINGLKSRCVLENEKCINGKCAVCGKEAKHLVIWGIQY